LLAGSKIRFEPELNYSDRRPRWLQNRQQPFAARTMLFLRSI